MKLQKTLHLYSAYKNLEIIFQKPKHKDISKRKIILFIQVT